MAISLAEERAASLRRQGIEPVRKDCQRCGKRIPPERARHPQTKYCSRTCQRAANDNPEAVARRMALLRQRRRDGEKPVAERRAERDREILAMRQSGETITAIAGHFRLHRDTVSEVCNRRWPRSDYASIRLVARRMEIALWRPAAERKGVPLSRIIREAANDIAERVVRGIA